MIANLDQRGGSRFADVRNACDLSAYDTGGAMTFAKGWNLIGIPLLSPRSNTAGELFGTLNGSSGLGANAVTALATYASGRFHLYMPSYSADQIFAPS